MIMLRENKQIVYLLFVLIIVGVIIYSLVNHYEKKNQEAYQYFLTSFKNEVSYLMMSTEKAEEMLQDGAEYEELAGLLLNIEKGISKAQSSLEFAGFTINKDIISQINFFNMTDNFSFNPEIEKDITVLITALNESLLYINDLVAKHSDELQNHFDITIVEFNNMVEEATFIYTELMGKGEE